MITLLMLKLMLLVRSAAESGVVVLIDPQAQIGIG
jgi:hypothetical protein